MKSHASAVAVLLLSGCAGNPLPPAPQQPAAANMNTPVGGEATSVQTRYDAVGWAATERSADPAQDVFVVHPTLPAGSFVELTLLQTGRTVVARVGEQAEVPAGYILTLSPVAAQAFGVGEAGAPVRVREVTVAPQDRAAAAGGSLTRIDAPQVLLAALRKRLPPAPTGAPAERPPVQPSSASGPQAGPAPIATVDLPPSQLSSLPSAPAPAGAPAAEGGWAVQVAALSNATRAEALARELGGFTVPAGALVRVRMGPFSSAAAAERGRAQAIARGYGDAKLIRND